MAISLFDIPLKNITAELIKNLIDNKVAENRYLDYKSELPDPRNDKSKTDLAKDVSSFANERGGDIIFGISENDKKEPVLTGLGAYKIDDAKIQLTNTINNQVEPRLRGLDFQPLSIDGVELLVLRIPQSLDAPHQLAQGPRTFWRRNSAGNAHMDYTEIKNAFISGEEIVEKARAWRESRLEEITAKEYLLGPMQHHTRMVLHLIPLAFKNPMSSPSIATFVENQLILRPLSGSCNKRRLNVDGFLISSIDELGVHSYCQVFRQGQIEIMSTIKTSKGFATTSVVPSKAFEIEFISMLCGLFKFWHACSISFPAVLSVSYQNTIHLCMTLGSGNESDSTQPIEEYKLDFPAQLIESIPSDIEQIRHIAKTELDFLWNAAGRLETPNVEYWKQFNLNYP